MAEYLSQTGIGVTHKATGDRLTRFEAGFRFVNGQGSG
jgi:hypothetical protein